MRTFSTSESLVIIPQGELIKIMDELLARHIQSLPQPTIEEKEELLTTQGKFIINFR